MPADGEHAPGDEVIRLVAVGHVGGVGQIEQVGTRQSPCDGVQHRQTAESGIEDANHADCAKVSLCETARISSINP